MISGISTRLLVEPASAGMGREATLQSHFWKFAADFVLRLADGRRHVIGHDFTPPPYRKKLEAFFQSSNVDYALHPDGISFEFSRREQIVGCLDTINWSCSLVIRVEEGGLSQAPVPQMRRRFFIRAPQDWYTEHETAFWAICFLGIDPVPALEVRTSRMPFCEMMADIGKATESTGLEMTETIVTGAVKVKGIATLQFTEKS